MKQPSAEMATGSWWQRWASVWGTVWLIGFGLFFYSFALPNNSHVHRLDLWLALPEFLWGTLFPEFGPGQGWSILFERVPIVFLSASIVLVGLALGRLILRGLGICSELERSARCALSGGIGLSLLSLMTLGLGLAGHLSRPLFVGVGLVFLVGEGIATWRDLRRMRAARTDPADQDAMPRWLMIAGIVLIVPFVAVTLAGAVLPSVDFDVKEYHLEGPKEFFLQQQITMLPHNVYTSFPFLTEMLTLIGMVLADDWWWGALVGKGVLFAFAPLTACGVFAFAKRIAGVRAGWAAAVLLLSTPWVYRMSIIAYTEGALCCYVLLSLLAFDTAIRREPWRRVRWWLIVGMLVGSATATKYPGLVFVAIPMALAAIVSEWRAGRQRDDAQPTTAQDSATVPMAHSSRLMLTIIALTLGGLITFGPWMAKNFAETGNPVYPLAYSVFGGSDWNADLQAKWRDAHGAPTHLFTQPVALVRDLVEKCIDVTAKSDWQGALVFGLIPLAFVVRQDRGRVVWLSLYALLFFLLWFGITHRIDRFWVPVLPVLCVLAGAGCAALFARWEHHLADESIPAMLPLVGTLLAVGWIAATLLWQFVFITTPLCGLNSYLTSYEVLRSQVRQSASLVDYLEQTQPDGGPPRRWLFVGEAQVFDSTEEYEYNTVFDISLFEEWTAEPTDAALPSGEKRLANGEAIRRELTARGITHIAVNWAEILRYRTTYRYTDYVTPVRFRELVELGVLVREPDGPQAVITLSDWPESWQQEVRNWGPELIHKSFGDELVPRFEVYRVK
ncbi:MAG: glycosyltransferase family 39 protein [Planctomycetaceae bacterium]|nr:glycosyltransferase family 39 protein [Planctomycetaceae bacterium]